MHRNEGADIMSSSTNFLGALAPDSLASFHAPHGTAYRVPASTRTRRNHGVFVLGNELAAVYSSRRDSDGRSVILSVGGGQLVFSGGMSPTQARAMAKALTVAAAAAEAKGGAQ